MMIEYADQMIDMHGTYSRKDFTNAEFIPVIDNINVYMTCFSCEKPDTHLFRENLTGVTFYNCNLDNVFIPEGNTVIGGSQRRYEVQDDGKDWIVDEDNNPIHPIGG